MADLLQFMPGLSGSVNNAMSITSIIPSMIFGIFLILAWLPTIYYTEKNNKGNLDEYNLLLEKIDKNIKLTDISDKISYSPIPTGKQMVDIYEVKPEDLIDENIYITSTKKTTTTTTNNNKTTTNTTIDPGSSLTISLLINGAPMDTFNYQYLAGINKKKSITIIDPNNSNISYTFDIFSIPKNKQIMQVEGLKEFQNELDMYIYDYEFGPKESAISTIKNRKSSMNIIQKWGGRLATFLMLFIGFSSLMSPLRFLIGLGSMLPGPFKIITLPGQILLSIYDTLSFFGSLILTLLMTLFIWSLINYPIVSVLIGALLIGLILYFKKK
jgi:hypothetical protein